MTCDTSQSSNCNLHLQAIMEQATERLRSFDDKIEAAIEDHHVIYSDAGADFAEDHGMAAWLKAKEHRRWDLEME